MTNAKYLLEALKKVQECMKQHKKYSHLGNGYLEEADEIISTAIAKAHGKYRSAVGIEHGITQQIESDAAGAFPIAKVN